MLSPKIEVDEVVDLSTLDVVCLLADRFETDFCRGLLELLFSDTFLLFFCPLAIRDPEDNIELVFFRFVVVSLLSPFLIDNKDPDLRRMLGLLLALFNEVDLIVLLSLLLVEERLDLELCTLRVSCLLKLLPAAWVLETFLGAVLEALDASNNLDTLLTDDCFTGDLEMVAIAFTGASFSSGDFILGV